MQLFSRPDQKLSTAGEIEQLKQAIAQQQQQLDELLNESDELQLGITQARRILDISTQQLTELQAKAAQEEQEQAIQQEVKDLRPIADRVNQLAAELSQALNEYQQRVEQIKSKIPPLASNFRKERGADCIQIPEIRHQRGSLAFVLKVTSRPIN